MAFKNYRTYCSTLLIIIITCESIYSDSATTKNLLGLKRKGTIKTIETDDGEVIDCVDIYKQPAFNNPLVKDLHMSPSSYPKGMDIDSTSNLKQLQDWHKFGECPKGTIPIRRGTSSNRYTKPTSFATIQRQSNHSIKVTTPAGHEFALVSAEGRPYYGARAKFNIWNPKVEYGEFSSCKLWIISEKAKDFYKNYNSVEAGWTVHPTRYHDDKTRFYIYWAGNGNKTIGCFDHECDGFVQINKEFTLGSILSPTSNYDGSQYTIPISIYKDVKRGDWWLVVKGSHIGYWPNSLFTSLSDHATIVNWGGEILNDLTEGHHTTTQMGSGHFPSERFGKAAFMWDLKIINSDYDQATPIDLITSVTSLGCYDIQKFEKVSGYIVYYGGPGFSSSCF